MGRVGEGGMSDTGAPEPVGDGPSGRPAGVVLGGKTRAAYSDSVAYDDRALRLPYPGGEHVLYTRCVLDLVERVPVGNAPSAVRPRRTARGITATLFLSMSPALNRGRSGQGPGFEGSSSERCLSDSA